jgi:hypothetical protein
VKTSLDEAGDPLLFCQTEWFLGEFSPVRKHKPEDFFADLLVG